MHFPVPSIAHIERYHAKFSDLQRDEIQIGDSVVWIFGKQIQPVVCATVIGATRWKGKRFLRLLPNHVASKLNEMWVRFDKNNFFLVSNNKNIRHRAPPNIIYAAYQDELNKVEEIYGPIRSRRQVLKYLTGKNLSVGEVAFRECHEILFKGIYTWAGNYRDIEVIVTNRQFPTLHPHKVKKAMRDFCHDFTHSYLRKVGNDRNRMLDALVFAHKELAWIHPFEDGNGRAIRLYLEIVAKSRGFDFDLSLSINSAKKKRYYHFAVRKAIDGYTRILRTLLGRALK